MAMVFHTRFQNCKVSQCEMKKLYQKIQREHIHLQTGIRNEDKIPFRECLNPEDACV